MLFHLLQKYPQMQRVVINDINPHLITAYRTIKDTPKQLIEQLSAMEAHYLSLAGKEAQKDFYLETRKTFNEKTLDEVARTCLLIFLNRTCFNGLYRENSKGKFNVPFGSYSNPTICHKETILADSELLNRAHVTIVHGDFADTMQYIDDEGINFVYLDPPYRPINTTSYFTSYVRQDFNDEEQIRLRNFAQLLNERLGVYWMLSNSDASTINPADRFLEDIYNEYYINRVYASRAINSNPAKRGKLTELLICNYPSQNHGLNVAEDFE